MPPLLDGAPSQRRAAVEALAGARRGGRFVDKLTPMHVVLIALDSVPTWVFGPGAHAAAPTLREPAAIVAHVASFA